MKALMGVVIAILVISIATLFWPSSSDTPVVTSKKEVVASTAPADKEPDTEDDKAEKMRAAYVKLEKARKQLQRRLADLQHEMWGMSFPPDEAKEIQEIMLNAHKFEKTPMMLGAFHNPEEIQNETNKVLFAIKSLDEVSASFKEEKVTNES